LKHTCRISIDFPRLSDIIKKININQEQSMKKYVSVALVVCLGVVLSGCGKKQGSPEDQEVLSMETLSTLGTNQTVTEVAPVPANLPTLPPSGPYKPSPVEIQTALKNASFYTGPIDGKLGPMSKKAVMEFQKANGLAADGKVGPKTWTALEKFLNSVEPAADTSAKKR
jgi:peptidoglycan hydrolase-like protein with peptidoglycan-binding domain